MNTFMPLEQLSALSMRKFSSREESLNAVLQAVSELLGMNTSFLSNISLQEELLTIKEVYVSEGGIPLEAGMQFPLSQTVCDMLVRAPVLEPLVINDIRHHPGAQAHSSAQASSPVNSYIGVPVTLTDGTFYGTLCAVDTKVQNLSTQHASFLLILARIVAMQIECERELVERRRAEASLLQVYEQLREANETLAALATTDVITGLPNHRATLSFLENILADPEQNDCTVCFIDLDHFKAVNDTYGHAAGDITLREIAQLMRRSIRATDFLGRWGGEEFVFILNTTCEVEALAVAERLRQTISTYLVPVGPGIHLSASLGVALSSHSGYTCEALIEAADKAMYLAKNSGRNRVCLASDMLQLLHIAEKDVASLHDESLRLEAVEGLAELLGAHDQYTGEHTQDVCLLVSQLAETIKLEKDEIVSLKFAARLHDIGKIAILDTILNKPGKLDPEEWTIMQRHAAVGADIVGCIPSLREIAPIIRGHHERWDGMGYPDKLAGEQIPFGARVIAVADSYSAMTTTRPYREASTTEWAQNELRRCAGLQFDPQIVEDFIRLLAGSPHCDAAR